MVCYHPGVSISMHYVCLLFLYLFQSSVLIVKVFVKENFLNISDQNIYFQIWGLIWHINNKKLEIDRFSLIKRKKKHFYKLMFIGRHFHIGTQPVGARREARHWRFRSTLCCSGPLFWSFPVAWERTWDFTTILMLFSNLHCKNTWKA